MEVLQSDKLLLVLNTDLTFFILQNPILRLDFLNSFLLFSDDLPTLLEIVLELPVFLLRQVQVLLQFLGKLIGVLQINTQLSSLFLLFLKLVRQCCRVL